MSQISETSRTIQQADTQSLQSAQALSFQQNLDSQSQQHRLVSQSERSGRTDRQRVQRSSSSASSRSGSAGVVGTSSYQQYSADGGFAQNTNNASIGTAVSGERRQGRYRRQVIRLPDQAQGQVRQVRRRLPTPEPDTLERVFIQRAAGEIVEEITEIPTTPPPRIQERTVVEPAGPPQVTKRTIRVPPRSGGYGSYQQQQQGTTFQAATNVTATEGYGSYQQQQQGTTFQAATNVTGTEGYGNIAQAPSSYQQFGGSYSGGYNFGAVPNATSTFGSIGGGYQQPVGQAPIVFSVGGIGSSQPLPPAGCQPAFCFYV